MSLNTKQHDSLNPFSRTSKIHRKTIGPFNYSSVTQPSEADETVFMYL